MPLFPPAPNLTSLGFAVASPQNGQSLVYNSTTGKFTNAATPAVFANLAAFPAASTLGAGALAVDAATFAVYRSDGTNWRVMSPRTQKSTRNGGDVGFVNALKSFDTATDLTVPCFAGDRIMMTFNATASAAAAANLFLDVVTVNNGVETNYCSGSSALTASGQGFMGAYAGATLQIDASVLYTVVAGDIFSGSTVLRVKGIATTAASATVFAQANFLAKFFAINLGPSA